MTEDIVALTSVDDPVRMLQLHRALARYRGRSPRDTGPLGDVTVRAADAADSSHGGVALGVSGALQVATRLHVDEPRDLGRSPLAIPLPPGRLTVAVDRLRVSRDGAARGVRIRGS